MKTLKQLIDGVNENLQELIGKNVKSVLEVCNIVREYIKKEEFYKTLDENGLKDLLVFENDIKNMKYVFLRSSEDDDVLRKIIEINTSIEYFNDSDLGSGGRITNVYCIPVEIGDKIKDLPLNEIIITLQITDILNKKNKIDQELDECKKKISNLEDISENYQIQLNELHEDLTRMKEK